MIQNEPWYKEKKHLDLNINYKEVKDNKVTLDLLFDCQIIFSFNLPNKGHSRNESCALN